jgi:hypothetical protein
MTSVQAKQGIEIKELLAKLLREPFHLFPARGERLQASNRKGVYIIYDPQDNVLHVGSTPRAKGGLGQRLRDHLRGNSSFTVSHFRGDGSCLSEGYKYRYLVIEGGRRRALVEALGIGELCPVHIGHGLDGEELDEK